MVNQGSRAQLVFFNLLVEGHAWKEVNRWFYTYCQIRVFFSGPWFIVSIVQGSEGAPWETVAKTRLELL